jgi:ferritin
VDDIVQKIKLVGTDGAGLFLIDRELKSRPAPAVAPGA